MKTKILDRPFSLKNADEATGKFSGYASVFGEVDFGRDIVMPGAFTKSLAKKKKEDRLVPVLWQHQQGTPIGVYESLKEDDHGLSVDGQLVLGVQQANEAMLLAKAGALTGISIGYTVVRDEWDRKKEVRLLHEVDLWEASLVTFPMLDTARVTDMKSVSELVTVRDVETYLRDACGVSAREAKALISVIQANRQQRDVVAEQAKRYKRLNDLF